MGAARRSPSCPRWEKWLRHRWNKSETVSQAVESLQLLLELSQLLCNEKPWKTTSEMYPDSQSEWKKCCPPLVFLPPRLKAMHTVSSMMRHKLFLFFLPSPFSPLPLSGHTPHTPNLIFSSWQLHSSWASGITAALSALEGQRLATLIHVHSSISNPIVVFRLCYRMGSDLEQVTENSRSLSFSYSNEDNHVEGRANMKIYDRFPGLLWFLFLLSLWSFPKCSEHRSSYMLGQLSNQKCLEREGHPPQIARIYMNLSVHLYLHFLKFLISATEEQITWRWQMDWWHHYPKLHSLKGFFVCCWHLDQRTICSLEH